MTLDHRPESLFCGMELGDNCNTIDELVGDTELLGDFECVLERGANCEYDEEVVLDIEDERIGQCQTRQVKLVNELFNAKGAGAHGDALEPGSGNLDSTSSGKRNQPTSYGNEHDSSDINYIGSPVPAESSQADALNFVESFLSYNNFGLSPLGHSTNMKKERSRLSLVKGIPDVAKRISLIRSTGDMETFKWVDASSIEEIADMQGSLYFGDFDKRSLKVDSAAMHFQSREYDAFPNESADNLDSVYLKKQRVASVCSHSASLKYVSGDSRQTTKVPGDIVGNVCNVDLDSNLDAETLGKEMHSVSVAGKEDEDVGFCTQMAAEVMESLSHAPSCITTVFYEDPWHTQNRSPQEVKAHVAGYENLPSQKHVCPGPGQRQLPAKRLVICALPFKGPKKQKLEMKLDQKKVQQEDMISSSAITRRTRQFRSGTRLEERVKDPENYPGRWTRSSLNSNILKRPKQVLSSNDLFEGGSSIILHHVSNGSDKSGTARTRGVNREKQIVAGLSIPLSRSDSWSYPKRKRTKRYYALAVADGRGKNLQISKLNAGNHSVDMERNSKIHQFAQSGNSLHPPDKVLEGDLLILERFHSDRDNDGSLMYQSEVKSFRKSTLNRLHSDNKGTCAFLAEKNSADGIAVENEVLVSAPGGNPANALAQNSTAGNDLPRSDYHKEPCKKSLPKSFMSKELIRLGITESMPDFTWKDLRKRRHKAHVRVLLSLHLGDNIGRKQKEILARLRVPIATSSADASHLIADKFTRTRNMLEFIALGKPVVTHLWLESCGQVGCLVDEKNFILRDARKEKELDFNMATSLARAAKHPLLEGRKVFITPNIKPDKEMITSLVKAVKGQVINRRQVPITEEGHVPDDILILSCVEDETACTPFVKKGAKIYSSELILSSIVAQMLEYERHELFRANKESNV